MNMKLINKNRNKKKCERLIYNLLNLLLTINIFYHYDIKERFFIYFLFIMLKILLNCFKNEIKFLIFLNVLLYIFFGG